MAITWAEHKKRRKNGEYDDFERERASSLAVVDKDEEARRLYQEYVQQVMASEQQAQIINNQLGVAPVENLNGVPVVDDGRTNRPIVPGEEVRTLGIDGVRAGFAGDVMAPGKYIAPDYSRDFYDWEKEKEKAETLSKEEVDSPIPEAPKMETPKLKTQKSDDLFNSIGQSINNARQTKQQNTEDFSKLSTQEKYNMYISELEDKAQKNGTLTQGQRNDVSEYMYRHLSDNERKAIDTIMRVESEDFNEFADYGRFGGAVSVGGQKAAMQRNAEKQAAINTLKDLGWDDERIKRDVPRFQELSDYRTTLKRNESLAIDPNSTGWEKFKKGTENTVTSIPSAVSRGIGSLFTENGAYGRNLSSKYRYSTNRANEAYRQVRENAIGNDHPIGQFLYDTGVSTGESLVTMLTMGAATGGVGLPAAIGKGASLVPFAANAYDSGYEDAVNRGFSEGEAQAYGLAVGGIEAATEIFSVDRLWDMATATKVGRNLFADMAAQAAIEGSEEVASELGGRFADYLVSSSGTGKSQKQLDMDEYKAAHPDATDEEAANYAAHKFIEDVVLAGVGGAISGGVSAVGANTVRGVRSKYGNNLTQAISDRYQSLEVKGDSEYEQQLVSDKERYENNPVQYIADNYKVRSEEDARVKKGLEEIAEKERSGKNLSVSDKAFITENVLQNNEQFNDQYLKDLFDIGDESNVPYEYRTVRSNITEDEARAMLGTAAAKGDTNAFVDAMTQLNNAKDVNLRDRASEIINDYADMAHSHGITQEAIGQARITRAQSYKAGLEGKQMENLSPENQMAYNKGKIEGIQEKARTTVQGISETQVKTKDGKSVKLGGAFTSDGKIKTENGSIRLENIDLSDDRAAVTAYKNADVFDDVNTKNAYLAGIKDGTNIKEYDHVFHKMFNSGLAGVTFDNAKKSYTGSIDENVLKAAWQTGETTLGTRTRKSLAEALGDAAAGTGKLINESKQASAEVTDFMTKIAERTGLTIRMVDDMGKGKRGSFQVGKSEITVNVTSADSVFHELGEFTESYNKAAYDELRNAITNFAVEKLGNDTYMRFNQGVINAKGERTGYRGAYEKIPGEDGSANEMAGEMFNDTIPIMMRSEKGRDALAKYFAENYSEEQAKTLGKQAAGYMKKLANVIKKLVTGADYNPYQKEMLKYSDELGEYADQFIKALDGAIENYRKTGKGAGYGEEKFANEIPKEVAISHMEMNENAEKVRNMEPVADLEFTRLQIGKKIKEKVSVLESYIEEKGWKDGYNNDHAGFVEVDHSGISDIMGHRDSEFKAAIFDVIPPVIENGLIVAGDVNHKERNYNTLVLVAPVTFNNSYNEGNPAGEYYAAVAVERKRNSVGKISQKLHVIDAQIISKESLESVGDTKGIAQSITNPLNLRPILRHIAAGVNIYEDNSTEKVAYSLDIEEQKVNDNTEEVAVHYDSQNEWVYPIAYSLETWDESEYQKDRKAAAKDLAKAMGITQKKALEYIDDINSIARIIADDRVRLDYDSDEGSAVVSNSDYGASIDFSTICKKRLLYTGTLQQIQKQIGNRVITVDDYLAIRQAMLRDNLETTCGCCYVEGSRAKLGGFMKEFIRKYAKTKPKYVPTMYDVSTPDGIRQLRTNHPEAYKARDYFLNHYGRIDANDKETLFASQQKPKDYTERKAYKGEILKMFKGKKDKVADKNLNGGLRLQSFSDFEVVNLLDCMQVITDMSRVGLAGQAYTKVKNFADALGNTGLKINLSLMAKGVDKNGNLILDEINGMKKSDAEYLRNKYSKNVGTIIVCFTDEQIKAAMKDNMIDFIIPFHRSQWQKSQYEALGLPEGTKDYTNYQEDGVIGENGRRKRADHSYMSKEYWDFSKNGRENAETYIKMCNDNNKVPVFDFLLEKDSKGKYVLPEGADGYFKLLIDFKMYDNDGVGSPQMPVRPDFSLDECRKMLMDYEGGHESFPVNQKIADEFTKKITKREKEFKYSLNVDSEGNKLTEGQAEYFKDSVIRDEDGNLKIMYHGTQNNFTIFDPKKLGGKNGTAEGFGIYFTENPEISQAYGGNQMKGYLNVTNPARYNEKTIKANDLTRLVKAAAEAQAKDLLEEGYDSLEEAVKDSWISNIEYTYDKPINQVYRLVAQKILSMNSNDMDIIQEIMADMAVRDYEDAYKFYDILQDTLGIDGFITEWEDSKTGEKNEVVVAIDSNQFKNIDNESPTKNEDVRYSLNVNEKASEDDVDKALNLGAGEDIRYSIEVTDPKTLKFLEKQKHIKVYRTFQQIGDGLYAPMNAMEGKNLGYKSQLGKWEQATEDPSKAVQRPNGSYAFPLKAGSATTSGKSRTTWAAYNPYLHSSNLVFNDQFSAAYDRPNLVVVECEVPVSEETSGYHADKAKDPVGWLDWKSGKVANALKKKGIARKVFLSRWMKPVRILDNSEVADIYEESLKGTDIVVPWNVVSPPLLEELRKRDVNIDYGYQTSVKASYNDKYSLDVGYHAGNLGKAESLFQSNGDRSTGHFGTGTYFVGDEEIIKGLSGYKDRPHYIVDFSKYNLYKPANTTLGQKLHEFLKGINSFYKMEDDDIKTVREWEVRKDDLEYNLEEGNISKEDAIKEARTLFGNYNLQQFISKEAAKDGEYWYGDGTVYDPRTETTYSYEEFVKDWDDDRFSEMMYDLIYDNKYVPRYLEKYEDFNREMEFDAKILFGISEEKARTIIQGIRDEIKAANYGYNEMKVADSASTRFMKALGYEGIDVRGLKGLDNTTYGSVIYDLKGEDLEQKIANGARYSLEVDSDGNMLSEDQKEYFKDSMIRDDNGNLKVMYHGTTKGGFTVFDPQKSDDSLSLFFTDNTDVATTYSAVSEMIDPYKIVAPIETVEDAVKYLESLGYKDFNMEDIPNLPDGTENSLEEMESATESRWGFYDENGQYYNLSEDMLISIANFKRPKYKGIYPVYLDIQNPLVVDAAERINGKVDNVAIVKTRGAINPGTKPSFKISFVFTTPFGMVTETMDMEKVEGYIAKTFGNDADKVMAKYDAMKDSYGFRVEKNVQNIYAKTDVAGSWSNIKFDGGRASTRYIAGYAYRNGYDGVYIKNVVDNGGAGGAQAGSSNIAIAFSSDQVKAVGNMHPTIDPDIRYSIDVDSEGRTLTEGQQRYFNNSKVIDEKGALKVMYHGARGAGFTVFDPDHSDDGRSLFFTDDPRVAKSYVGTYEKFKPLKPMTFDELASAMEGYTRGEIYLEEDGNDVVIMEVGAIQEDDKEVYRGNLKGAQEYFIDSIKDEFHNTDANYEVYLNLQNPYIMDAKGANWDELNDDVGFIDHFGDVDITKTDAGYEVEWMGKDFEWYHDTFKSKEDLEKKFGKLYELDDRNETFINDIYIGKDGNRIPTSTRMISQMAQEMGYDGVIIKNIYDVGMYASTNENVSSTVAIAFSPEQIKDIDNINPTSSEDIRYALDLDDEFINFDEYLSGTEQKTEEQAAEILKEGMEALKNKDVDLPKLRNLALKLRNEFGSSFNTNVLTDNLEKAFAYMQTEDHVDYKTMLGILKDIARPVVEESNEKVGEDEYKAFINSMKGYKIRLTDLQKSEVRDAMGSYGAFCRAMMPLTISDNGEMTLDQLWDEMVEASGYALERDVNEGDMPAALLDTLTSLRPAPKNIYGGDVEDVSRDLAMRIIEEYVGGEISRKMQKEIKAYKERLKKDYNERLEKYKGRSNADVLARNKKRLEQAKERELVRNLRHDIKLDAKKLMRWIEKPVEGKSIPHDLMVPVMQFLNAFDFVDPDIRQEKDGQWHTRVFQRVDYENGHKKFIYKDLYGTTREDVLKQFNEAVGRGEGTKEQRFWAQSMAGLKDLYDKVLNDDDFEDNSMDFLMETLAADDLAKDFSDLLSRNRDSVNMNQLSSKDLTLINNIIKNIFHAINQGNKAYTMSADISNLAQETMKEAEGKTIKSRGKFAEGMYNYFRLNEATPKTFFKLLGNSAYKMYKSMRSGLNTEILDIKKASEFMKEISKDFEKGEINKWTGDNAVIHDIALTNGSIKLTDGYIMSLYLTMRRDGASERTIGGFRPTDIKQNGRPIKQGVVYFTENDLQKIFSVLTPEQIEFAKKMQRYMATECAKAGNETSLKMFGFKKYTEENYYPWRVDPNSVSTNNASANIPRFNAIKNSGFTKQLKEGARNTLLIDDIFNVFTDHVAGMARYHGYAASLADVMRWLNYREAYMEDGKSIARKNKDAINVITGSEQGVRYIEELVLDVNQVNSSQYIGNFTEALMGNYKAAAVGANARVIIQQPTAYMRALRMIDAKYLLVNPSKAMKNIKRSQEESAISWWKSKGYYETNLGQPLKEIVTGVASPVQKVKDAMMAPAGWADDVTWGFLYTAVENEQRAKYKGQNLTDEQFRKAVNDRFDEVIDSTQVVDSTLHRSAYMRSKDTLNVIQTAFMAEPTKTYNMLMEAIIEDLRDGKAMKRTARASAAFLITAIVNAAAQSLPDVLRHAGDDDDWWEKYKEYILANFKDNINPFNMLPVLKEVAPDIFSIFTGEYTWSKGSSRFDVEAINSVKDAVSSWVKFAQGEGNKTGYGMFMATVKPISQVTGIPLYNLARDSIALYNAFFDNLETTINKGNTAKNEKKKEVVSTVDREKSEDQIRETITSAIEHGVSIYDLKGSITSEYKNKYFDAYSEGDMDKAKEIANKAAGGFAVMGMSDEEIDEIINDWQEEAITYSALDKAIADGEGIAAEILHVQEGKDDDKIIKHIMDRFTSTVRYEDDNNTESQWRENVEEALQTIDPTLTFDDVAEDMAQKAQEKAEKAEAEERVKGMKSDFFQAVDSKDGTAGRKALDALKAEGKDAKSIKSSISTYYHDAWKEATTQAEKDKAKQNWKSAYTLVNNYFGATSNDLDKTWSDWEKKQ